MITATIDMSGFNRGLDGLIRQAGLNARVVVRKEAGELIKTLVRISPKADINKIRSDIESKFTALANPSRAFEGARGGIHGSGDVDWYAVNSHALFGVAKDSDQRGASVEELKQLLYKTTHKGRIRGRRGKQAVYITQKILTKAATRQKLITQKIRNRGRLAAGWMVAAFRGAVLLTGSGQPPAFVTRHAAGARGYFLDGTSNGDKPAFTIANTAAGVSKDRVVSLARTAVAIRAKAMAANARLFMRGKKNLADYAGGAR